MHALTRFTLSILLLAGILSLTTEVARADVKDDLKILTSVDHRAAGNIEARAAYTSLVKNDRDVLPQVLKAMNGANPLAENYLGSAFQVIVAEGEGELPLKELTAYLHDQTNNQKARAMVFELFKEEIPDRADAMLDDMLMDESADIRYQAIQKVLDNADVLDEDERKQAYLNALDGASAQDQVTAISDALKELGVKVDLQKHFGLLTDWKIIGPFDNKDMKAFDVVYPPEEELEFGASYEGMEGQVQWQTISSDDPMGIVNIADSIGPYKGAVMYMYSEYDSASDRDVVFRMATANAWKLWVNGELVFAREEYHRGMRWDQYRIPVSLKEGTNKILFKILQNEQTQPWAQKYEVQMRVCDQQGATILPRTPYDPTK